MHSLGAVALLTALGHIALADIPVCRANYGTCYPIDVTGLKGAVTQAAAGTGGQFIFSPNPMALTYNSGECEVAILPNNGAVYTSVTSADVASNIQDILDNCVGPDAASQPSGKGQGGEAAFVPGQGSTFDVQVYAGSAAARSRVRRGLRS